MSLPTPDEDEQGSDVQEPYVSSTNQYSVSQDNVKIRKTRTLEKITLWFYHREVHPKDDDGVANRMNVPSEAVDFLPRPVGLKI